MARKNLSQFVLLYSLIWISCGEKVVIVNNVKSLSIPEEIDSTKTIPEYWLGIDIDYVSNRKITHRGFWPFRKDYLEIMYKLTNNSDTTIYVETPFPRPIGGNPSFLVKMISDTVDVYKKIISIIDYVPVDFLRLEPNSTFIDTIDLLEDNGYEFEHGKQYEISATFSSSWGSFTDNQNISHRVWHGIINSNVLDFAVSTKDNF